MRPADVIVDAVEVDPALEFRGNPQRHRLRRRILVEIFLIDAAERRPEGQKRRECIPEPGVVRTVVAKEIIDDDRALAVRQEDHAVVALVLHEVFENQIEPGLNALAPQAPIAHAEHRGNEIRRRFLPRPVVVVDQIAGEVRDVGDAATEEERQRHRDERCHR